MRCFTAYLYLALFVLFLGCKEETVIPEDGEQEESPVTGGNIVPNDFLSAEKFEELVVEIQYVKGYQPKAESVNNLKSFLQARLHKPAGIRIVQHEMASPGQTAYSLTDIRTIEKAGRTQQSRDKVLTAYFFFADGDYAANSGDSKVLGVAYGRTSMAIFGKTIQEFSGGLTQPSVSTLETTVIYHELAHILGLVNNGTPMQQAHQDEAHGRHCNQKSCLMYYTAETSDIVGNLVGGNIPELDAACLADLRANGGK